nr:exocyst complex component SEC8-like [Tanacetum cinerariifolium]
NHIADSEADGVELEISELLMKLRPIKQESLIRDNNKLILLASLSDSLEYIAESIERFGNASGKPSDQTENDVKPIAPRHKRMGSVPHKDLASFAEDYRKLAIDCLKVLRVEMQLETVFNMQVMATREYLEDQDAEEPDDYVISLITQITRRDEVIAPFIAPTKRNYVFGGICAVASHASIKALAEMKRINLFGVQQICRNTIALEQMMLKLEWPTFYRFKLYRIRKLRMQIQLAQNEDCLVSGCAGNYLIEFQTSWSQELYKPKDKTRHGFLQRSLSLPRVF